jgi:hypothetical protein
MHSSELKDLYYRYSDILNNLNDIFINDYDKYPILTSIKLNKEASSEFLINKILKEKPYFILTDERLYDFLRNNKQIKDISKEISCTLGYWLLLKNIKIFFCNLNLELQKTKIILYNRNKISNSTIVVEL